MAFTLRELNEAMEDINKEYSDKETLVIFSNEKEVNYKLTEIREVRLHTKGFENCRALDLHLQPIDWNANGDLAEALGYIAEALKGVKH